MRDWATDTSKLPYHLQGVAARGGYSPMEEDAARRAYYALCTQIDQQIGSLIGTGREEGTLDDTIIMFTSDHGDMLGNHNLWAKQTFYEWSAGIPMILVGTRNCPETGFNRIDDHLVCLKDVMPILLELCPLPVPKSVEGVSMVSGGRREWLRGEFGESGHSSRMVRDRTHKLIYYPTGNAFQLFDLVNDPNEMVDPAGRPDQGERLERLKGILRSELYGSDLGWITDGEFAGEPASIFRPGPNRSSGAAGHARRSRKRVC